MWDSQAPAPLCMPLDTIEAVGRQINICSADLFRVLDSADKPTLLRLAREAEHLTRLFDVLWSEAILRSAE